MRGMWMGRTAVHARHQLWMAQVGNIQDEHAVVPIGHVQPIAHAQRMVAARFNVVVPWVFLACRHVLPRNPPLADLFGPGGVMQVQDLDDVAHKPLGGR
ncbi:hypothetical protein D3C87_1583030 [compost metagenome]